MNAEIELKAGQDLTVTTNDDYMEKVDEEFLWVDYKNITEVVDVGKHIYIDDGLISILVKEKGNTLSPHDALEHHFTFLKTSLIFDPLSAWQIWQQFG